MRGAFRLIAGVAVAALMPSGAQAETPKSGGTLTYAVTAEAPTYDCHATTTYAAIHTLAPHYSLLLKVDNRGFESMLDADPQIRTELETEMARRLERMDAEPTS